MGSALMQYVMGCEATQKTRWARSLGRRGEAVPVTDYQSDLACRPFPRQLGRLPHKAINAVVWGPWVKLFEGPTTPLFSGLFQ
jgi:hypothetical protein